MAFFDLASHAFSETMLDRILPATMASPSPGYAGTASIFRNSCSFYRHFSTVMVVGKLLGKQEFLM